MRKQLKTALNELGRSGLIIIWFPEERAFEGRVVGVGFEHRRRMKFDHAIQTKLDLVRRYLVIGELFLRILEGLDVLCSQNRGIKATRGLHPSTEIATFG